MGQKVHPSAFRRGVRIRGLERRHPVRFSANASGSKDRLGWSMQMNGLETQRQYGSHMSNMSILMSFLKEFFRQHKLVMNRVAMKTSEDYWLVMLETLDPISCYDPMLMSKRQQEIDGGLRRVESMIEDELHMRGDYVKMVQIAHRSVESLVSDRPGWMDARDAIYDKLVSKPTKVTEEHLREYFTTTMVVEAGSDTVKVLEKPSRTSGNPAGKGKPGATDVIKEVKELTRVTPEGLITAMRCAGAYPVAQGLSERVSMKLEESLRQSDAISDIKKTLEAVAAVEDYGLIDISTMERLRGKRDDVEFQGYHGILGYRYEIKGVIDGSRRTRKEVIKGGMLPNSSMTVPMDFGQSVAKTKVGTRGVRVQYYYK